MKQADRKSVKMLKTRATSHPPAEGKSFLWADVKYSSKESIGYGHNTSLNKVRDLNHVAFSDHRGITHKLVIKRFKD